MQELHSTRFSPLFLGNRIYHTWGFQVDLGLCFSEPQALAAGFAADDSTSSVPLRYVR